MNALCIVVDGLRPAFLGCYGNAWTHTPAIDRLAAGGFVFDQACVSSVTLDDFYEGAWQGLEKLTAANIMTALVTDEPALAGHRLAGTWDEIAQVAASQPRTAATIDETQMAALFSAAAEWIEAAKQPFCLWLHAMGMQAAWDAPAALRQQYAEGEELSPPTLVDPPSAWLPADGDPDELLRLRWAYAAQVCVLDHCLGAFLSWFDSQPAAQETLLLLTAPRGFPLGEHRRVGMAASPAGEATLYEELIHVPCILRIPKGVGAADRSQALTQGGDMAATLLNWLQIADGESPTGQSILPLLAGDFGERRDYLCMHSRDSEERAIRTAAWHLIVPAPGVHQLYVKPDDRAEVNEVADRCGDVAELLAKALEECQQAGTASGATLPRLADALFRGLA